MFRVPKEIFEQQDTKPGELVEVQIRKARKDGLGMYADLRPSPERMNSTHMDKLVVDSWAWLEYLRGSSKGSKVRERIDQKMSSLLTWYQLRR